MPYVFDLDRLRKVAVERSAEYRDAEPYPHVVVDDFLPLEHACRLAEVFPAADDASRWDRYNAPGYEVKLGCGDETKFPDYVRNAIHDLNSGPFIRVLEEMTGIEHLLPDPHLLGGGMHMTLTGGHLGVHADFNWHKQIQAHRRLNLLLYLTHDWQPSYAGELELWDATGTHMVRRVEPLFNRMVLFSTRSDTFHGHPRPWAAPADIFRRSIALYYYTSSRPEAELRAEHSTLYKGYNA